MTNYAWGRKQIPYPILKEHDDLVVVDIRGSPTAMPVDRVHGRLSDGDRIQFLAVSGRWCWATVSGYDRFLKITFDDGREGKLSTTRHMRIAA
jgi:hypothetical protein